MAFKVQLSNFTYVDRAKKSLGRALRFTFGFQAELENGLKCEMVIEGCLGYLNYMNALVWQPPMVKFGMKQRQLHWMNPTLYNIVLDALQEHPEILAQLNTPMQQLLKAMPKEEPPNTELLPQIIEKVSI